jgi:2-succinyl-6-hydroxy-2,4-cyclohexadiene-1-carboxylate synthase
MRIELGPGFGLNVERSGSGSPLVLLHGFTGSVGAWSPLRESLAERFTLFAIDVVGHGLSDKPATLDHYFLPQAAADVVRAVEIAGLSKCAWLGYSMGGRLALRVATDFPQAVERLALIGASPGLASPEERGARVASDELLAQNIERDGVEAFIDYWENIPLFASQKRLPPERQAAIRAGRLRNDTVGLASSLRGMGTGTQEPLHDRLTSLRIPVLALAGELDTKYTAIAREMAAAIPDALTLVVPGAGHAAHTENPDFCGAAIAAFLSKSKSTEGIAS